MTQHAQLGDVADIVRGIAFPKEAKSLEPLPGHIACLRTTNVQRQVEWDDLWFVPVEHVRRDEQFVRAGDILISTANSYELVGKVAPVIGVPHKSTLGAFISLIRAREGVEPKYLYHQLAWGKTQARIRELASTTTNISNVSTKKLALLDLHVPPLSEQRLVVAEIEKQFSRLDEAVANLQRVKANLKRYRAAVLRAAFDGHLVVTDADRALRLGSKAASGESLEAWIHRSRREKWHGRGKWKDAAAPGDDTKAELPEGWALVSWEALLAAEDGAFKRGPFGSALTKVMFVDSGFKVYEQYCPINDDCSFARYYITPEKFDEMRAFEVRAGDFLISCSGVTLGRITRVPAQFEQGVINQALLRVRLNTEALDPSYFLHLFRSPQFQRYLFDRSAGAAIPNLRGVDELKAIPIAVPPMPEQLRIVAEVDRRLSIVREVETEVEADLKRADRLRQSTLARAFRADAQ